MVGFSLLVSSSVPAFTNAKSGIASTKVVIGEPHSEQKLRWTGRPLSPLSRKSLNGPLTLRTVLGTATITENAVPACFWQFLQWQMAVITGSAVEEYLTLPQRQPPLKLMF